MSYFLKYLIPFLIEITYIFLYNCQMKKQIKTFLITFLIGTAIALFVLKSFVALEKNPNQIKFEEERALLYDNQSSLTNARDVDCNFINKYGTTFVNWTGEMISDWDDEVLIIESNRNGIKVQYKTSDFKHDFEAGDNVYFSFHPIHSESDDDECFDETSFTESGALRAPEYMANIFRLSKDPWDISENEILKIENSYKKELTEIKEKKIKEEEESKQLAERKKREKQLLKLEDLVSKRGERRFSTGYYKWSVQFYKNLRGKKNVCIFIMRDNYNDHGYCRTEATFKLIGKNIITSGAYNPYDGRECIIPEGLNGIWEKEKNGVSIRKVNSVDMSLVKCRWCSEQAKEYKYGDYLCEGCISEEENDRGEGTGPAPGED